MRKAVFVLVALSTMGIEPALAQTPIDIGIRGGVNLSDLDIENESTDALTGFVGGGFATFHLGQIFFLQPEVLYSQKGATMHGLVSSRPTDIDVRLDYLEVPLLFGTEFFLRDFPITPRLYAGPTINFELSCDLEATIEGADVSVECSDDESGVSTKSPDFGVIFGGAAGLGIQRFKLWLDVRYQLGLTNIDDFSDDGSGDPAPTAKNRAWQFFLGLGIPVN